MLGIADSLKQTRFYQEARQEEAKELILKLLNYRFGQLSQKLKSQVEALSLEQLEQLGKALLDFTAMGDLLRWLQANPAEE